MKFFDITGITGKIAGLLKRKKVEVENIKKESTDEELPPEVYERFKEDKELEKLYYSLEDVNKEVLIDSIKSGKIDSKSGLKKTIQRIIKREIPDDMVLAINYYCKRVYKKEFTDLPDSKQQEVLYKLMKGLPQNKILKIYNMLKQVDV